MAGWPRHVGVLILTGAVLSSCSAARKTNPLETGVPGSPVFVRHSGAGTIAGSVVENQCIEMFTAVVDERARQVTLTGLLDGADDVGPLSLIAYSANGVSIVHTSPDVTDVSWTSGPEKDSMRPVAGWAALVLAGSPSDVPGPVDGVGEGGAIVAFSRAGRALARVTVEPTPVTAGSPACLPAGRP